MLICLMAIWNILRPFGIRYGRLVYIICGHWVYFSRFGMFGPRKSGNPGVNREFFNLCNPKSKALYKDYLVFVN
jgi:hypothetical protein